MIIKKEKLQRAVELLKHVDSKEGFVTIGVKDKKIIFSSKSAESVIRFKGTPIESEDVEDFSIKKEYLLKMLKSGAEEFNIKLNEKSVTTKIGSAKITSSLGSPEMAADFEEVSTNKNFFHIDKEIMESLLLAKNFVNEKTNKKALVGVNIYLLAQTLMITATDSFKFYTKSFELPNTKETDSFSVTLPLKAIDALSSIFAITNDKGFEVRVDSSGLYLNSKPLYFRTTLIAEVYPNVKPIMDKLDKQKDLIDISLDDKQLNELKLIGTASQFLNIRGAGGEDKPLVVFRSSTEVEVNESATKVNKFIEFEKAVNYKDFIEIIQKTGTVTVKDTVIVAKNSTGSYILQLARIESPTQ